jgi:hypothetical protein
LAQIVVIIRIKHTGQQLHPAIKQVSKSLRFTGPDIKPSKCTQEEAGSPYLFLVILEIKKGFLDPCININSIKEVLEPISRRITLPWLGTYTPIALSLTTTIGPAGGRTPALIYSDQLSPLHSVSWAGLQRSLSKVTNSSINTSELSGRSLRSA